MGVTATEHRRTGTLAKVVDDNLNSWEDFAGQDINIPVAYQYVAGTGPEEWEQGHWSYRGQAAMCARTTDGAIVRVRIGDGTLSDRTIYRQIVTDPTDPAQWVVWTQLYTGDHFAIAIMADASAGAGYRIFHAKSDGLYRDNSLLYAPFTGIVKIKPIGFTSDMIYFQTVGQAADGNRRLNWYYFLDTNSPIPASDPANYAFYRNDLVAFRGGYNSSTSEWAYYRLRSCAHDGGARELAASETLTLDYVPTEAYFSEWARVRFLKGPSGQAGFKAITNLFVMHITTVDPQGSGYFMFYNETHQDAQGNSLSNLKMPLFWSRSFGLPTDWSQPTPIGYSVWGFAGGVLWGDHLYIAGNSRVFRRPVNPTSYDISNYVIEGESSIPRENGQGGGKLVCANPSNVVGKMLGIDEDTISGLTNRRLILALGTQGVNDKFMSWKRDNSWWLSQLIKHRDGAKQRLTIEFGDIWHRLSNPFRDSISIPGQFEWRDWSPSGSNQLYNYFNSTDEFFRYNPAGAAEWTVPRLKVIASVPESVTLFAGWRGENGFIEAGLYDGDGIVFRYQDADNYYVIAITGSSLDLKRIKDGVSSTITSFVISLAFPFVLGIDFRWGHVKLYVNYVLVRYITMQDYEKFTGFVGFQGSTELWGLRISEFHWTETTATLLKRLFAYADEHEVEIDQIVTLPENEVPEGDTSAQHINTLWGPQSDLTTPEQAVRQLLESSKVEVIWLEDS